MHEFRKLHKMGESKKLKVVYKTAKKNKKILVTCDISPSVIKGVISFKFHWMHGFETSMIYTKNSIRCFPSQVWNTSGCKRTWYRTFYCEY